MKKRRIIKAAALTLFVFTLLGWLYIAIQAIVYPETITVRENAFALICFTFSMVSFFVWNLVKESFSLNVSF